MRRTTAGTNIPAATYARSPGEATASSQHAARRPRDVSRPPERDTARKVQDTRARLATAERLSLLDPAARPSKESVRRLAKAVQVDRPGSPTIPQGEALLALPLEAGEIDASLKLTALLNKAEPGHAAMATFHGRVEERFLRAIDPGAREALLRELDDLSAHPKLPADRKALTLALRDTLSQGPHEWLNDYAHQPVGPARSRALAHLRAMIDSPALPAAERGDIVRTLRDVESQRLHELMLTANPVAMPNTPAQDALRVVGRALLPVRHGVVAAAYFAPTLANQYWKLAIPPVEREGTRAAVALGFAKGLGVGSATAAAGVAAAIATHRLMEGAELAHLRHVIHSPMADNAGVDRKAEVIDLLTAVSASAATRAWLAASLVAACASKEGAGDRNLMGSLRPGRQAFAKALADFAASADEATAERALHAISSHPMWASEHLAELVHQLDNGLRRDEMALEGHRFATDDLMEAMGEPLTGADGGSRLNDPQVLARVQAALKLPPLSSQDGIYFAIHNVLTQTPREPRDIVARSLRDAKGGTAFDPMQAEPPELGPRLQALIAQERQRLLDRDFL